ncbi:hypothetical protein BN9982_390002 [Mycobacterium tuberculosis]|nr:hypothetical protein BN9982_390002 [Mycobacterium tuberculosis]
MLGLAATVDVEFGMGLSETPADIDGSAADAGVGGVGGSTTGASGVHEFPTEPGAAGLDGEPGRSVAFGSRVSTLVFSRFTSLIRSCRRLPSVTACTR